MTVTTTNWLDQITPHGHDETAWKAYFGVPPQPESALVDNIKRKRQHWHKRKNSTGNSAKAEQVKKYIQELSEYLLKGGPAPRTAPTPDGRRIPIGPAETIDELIDLLDELLNAGDLDRLVRISLDASRRWPANLQVTATLALALSSLIYDGHALPQEAEQLAELSAIHLVRQVPRDPRGWLAMARFTAARRTTVELFALERNAAAAGAALPADVYGIFADAHFRVGDRDSGTAQLVRSVAASGGDAALRSIATDALINSVLLLMLPLGSSGEARAFAEAVEVAAWCATGVPESEAAVLPFRIWSNASRNLTFVGDHGTKAFVGILTGFTILPAYNAVASKAGWKVLLDGPWDKKSWSAWLNIAGGDFVQQLHHRAARKFEWHQAGYSWPTREHVLHYASSTQNS